MNKFLVRQVTDSGIVFVLNEKGKWMFESSRTKTCDVKRLSLEEASKIAETQRAKGKTKVSIWEIILG